MSSGFGGLVLFRVPDPHQVDRLAMVAADLVRLGEVRHKDSHCIGMLLVILTCLASDGHGQNPGGVQGERWRTAFGRAAAVAVPLRVPQLNTDFAFAF